MIRVDRIRVCSDGAGGPVSDGVPFRSYDPALEDSKSPVTLRDGQFLRRPEGISYLDPGSGLVGVQRAAEPAGVVGSHMEGVDKPFQGLSADDLTLQCTVNTVFKEARQEDRCVRTLA
jgi:hypothetical protein